MSRMKKERKQKFGHRCKIQEEEGESEHSESYEKLEIYPACSERS